MNVVQPIRGEKGAPPISLDADSHGTKRRAIVDTHRHPWGKKMQSKIEERGLLDPKQGFPQTNARAIGCSAHALFDLRPWRYRPSACEAGSAPLPYCGRRAPVGRCESV
jgi:hypothetical protein